MDSNIEIKLNMTYIKAIQDLKGDTLPEKKETISRKIKEIVDHCRSSGMTYHNLSSYLSKVVSVGLIPYVKVEVCRELKWSIGIKEALLSTDNFIFSRALKAKWFFNGTIKNTVSPEFYDMEILPYIAYNNRSKIVKTLSIYLSDTDIAEEFYKYICDKYSRNQALSLLAACSFEFIFNLLQKEFFVIPVNVYDSIHKKHPLLLVDYVKLSPRKVKLMEQYKQFWVKYIPDNISAFIELKDYFNTNQVLVLSKSKTEFLLKNAQKFYIKDVAIFLRITEFGNVEKYISFENIRKLIRNRILKKRKYFVKNCILSLLRIFEDKRKYLNDIRSIYKEVHGLDLLEVRENMCIDIVMNLSENERDAIAYDFMTNISKELQLGSWYPSDLHDTDDQWLCLSTVEFTIIFVEEALEESNKPIAKYFLWKLIVRTCRINDDISALVNFLIHFNQQYVNDHTILVFNLLVFISQEFVFDDLLCKEISSLLKTIYLRNAFSINMSEVDNYTNEYYYKKVHLHKYELSVIQTLFDKIFECKIYYNCKDTEEFMEMYCRIYIDSNDHCDFFNNISEIETKKKCLKLAIKHFQSLINIDSSKVTLFRIIYDLISTINCINKKKSNNEKFDIRDHPWIVDNLNIIINDPNYTEFENVVTFTKSVYQELPELYQITDLIKLEGFVSSSPLFLLKCLKKHPKESLSCVEDISNMLISNIGTDKFFRYYINSSLWVNKFPLALFDEFLMKNKMENKQNIHKCLALICDESDLKDINKKVFT